MSKYNYLIVYSFKELNNDNGVGQIPATFEGELTLSKINEIRTELMKSSNYSQVVILNIIRLEKIKEN